MGEPTTIYLELLNEDVAVWRPVQAEPLGEGRFRVLGRQDDEDEVWEFPPGSVVSLERRHFEGGEVHPVAISPR